nr:uncharacterized protein LOC126534043 isoform X4 [Dermacentor andersoni]
MGEKLLLVVLCITSFTVLESRKTFSIRKFLNTTSPIWTYNTTRGSHGFCNVDVMIYINRTHVLYNHIFYERTHQRKSMAMTGAFVRKDALVVQVHGCRNKYREEILFFDKWFKCAVVKVMSISCLSGRTHKHDLRVWNSSILARPSAECMREYSKVERNGHVIYNSNCHHILDNRPLSRYRQLNET